MRITLKQLLHLSVETRSGAVLGKVRGIVFETDGHAIAQYIVRHSRIIGDEYRIAPVQVARFEKGRMVVDDTARGGRISPGAISESFPNAESAAMRSE